MRFPTISGLIPEKPTEKELKTYRILLLIGVITHPLIGLIRNYSDINVTDPMSVRWIIASSGLLTYLLSYRSTFVRNNFILLVYLLAYAVSVHILSITGLNSMSVNYVIGYFLILISVSIIFYDVPNLLLYLVLMNAGALLLCAVTVSPPVKVSVFLSASITISLVIYFALRSKILTNRELDRLNRQLLEEIRIRKIVQEEVLQLNKNLKKNLAELEAVNSDLEAFSYSAAHDLRAPLRIINQFAGIFKKKYASHIDEDAVGILELIIKNTKDMDKLIYDLIDFSRLGKKQVKKEEINVESLVKGVLDNVFSADIKPGTEIRLEDLPPAQADYTLLQQVFINLISNALKYSSPRERVIIAISAHSTEKENVYCVRDNGTGFDMKYSHKLFAIFSRLHHKEEFEGTGLGLAIVKRIIDKHNGRVWAESGFDQGAAFYFSLPKS
jgi:signal transduction histidine kinase